MRLHGWYPGQTLATVRYNQPSTIADIFPNDSEPPKARYYGSGIIGDEKEDEEKS